MEVVIVGGGIGGLTLALTLEKAGIASRVFESSPEIRPVGVGINLLPHATKELARLGLDADLARVAVETREAVFFNRFGQLIYREPLGRAAGYEQPQFSVHRGDLQTVLLEAVRRRLGNDRVLAGWKCVGFEQDASGAAALFRSSATGEDLPPQRGSVTVYAVVEGRGRSTVGEQTFDWGPRDVFVVPSWAAVSHEAGEDAVLFSFSDRPVQKALGLWREEVVA
jgi:2-polyprenyl-6-methoxyphenol hydroxylase-like FAD-dependent oxidoreductase